MSQLLRSGEGAGALRAKAKAVQGRRLVSVLAVLVLIAILVWPAVRRAPDYGSREAESGYSFLVGQLTQAGVLRLAERESVAGARRVMLDRGRLAELVEASADGQGPLGDCRRSSNPVERFWRRLSGSVESSSAECEALIEAFIRASFLREDMRIDSGAIWEIDGDRLIGLAPGAHMVSDATRSITQWQGSVDFAKPYQSLMLVDAATRKVLFRFDARQRNPVVLSPAALINDGAAELSGGNAVLRARGRQCAGSATISQLGDHALLTLLPINAGSDCPDIWFDGELVHSRDPSLGGFRYRVLRPGQTIRIMEDKPVVLQLVRSIGAVSALDEGRRRNETTLAAVGTAISGAGPTRSRVPTSIDPVIHFTAQQRLEALGVRELAGERSSFRAAAMLVDGLTGEIVAAPTFPISPNQLVESDRKRAQRLNWLGLNMNLQALDVGSTAKVPIATAIVQEHPQLLTLRTTGKSPGFTRLLGEPLVPGRNEEMEDSIGAGQSIDFPTFVARSSNYYALLLMKLAASPQPLASNGKALAPGEGYAIAGVARSRAPRMPANGQMWGMTWAEQLWRLTCVMPYPIERSADQRWARAGCPRAYYADPGITQPERLAPIQHNSPNLRFNFVQPGLEYPDYLMSILGQNRSRWTNAALIQAYARILSDRRVGLRFDRPTELERERGQPVLRLGLNPQVWRNVTQGMAGAVEYGTANRLQAALGPFPGLAVYAKTGTPTVPRVPGENEVKEQGHVIVVAFVRYSGGVQDPANICAMRMVSINIQDRDGDEKAPALDLLLTLMAEPAIANWLRAPCAPSGGRAK